MVQIFKTWWAEASFSFLGQDHYTLGARPGCWWPMDWSCSGWWGWWKYSRFSRMSNKQPGQFVCGSYFQWCTSNVVQRWKWSAMAPRLVWPHLWSTVLHSLRNIAFCQWICYRQIIFWLELIKLEHFRSKIRHNFRKQSGSKINLIKKWY